MDGLDRWAAADTAPPRALPFAAGIVAYLAFFALLFLACSVRATPARVASGTAMALSVAAWALCILYRKLWEARHRRNRRGIMIAGAPDLELDAYRRRIDLSVRLLGRMQTTAIFVSLPTAVLALALLTTSCLLAFDAP